ncbi:hypothetical protein ABZS66_38645 [Dactylosporangium sp. NPDC005572]|uniref:hypothetical protein n=1 Tax=Dactylosporangium sp. NPDC005572 TaxID=3156889 RepID=UPI0033BA39D4
MAFFECVAFRRRWQDDVDAPVVRVVEPTELWLAERGLNPLRPNGIKILLKRLGAAAGVQALHAHRWRHSYAHEWKTRRRRHGRPHAAARLGVRRHAASLRRERRR